ncbi:Myc-type, basic helix-loop-helix (bHLH) domain-containing protein [Cynara cardunculus var. scolymus]|uniref:Myc-type, basic helix-loop-helix (BHLH) domain-containing protein n=2 Tax=Cynara cardunculus var. scolymus TaxID=59895 RepID=A0A103Y092_CYNCS|nr:Myc-type, basic helix-loop-helix (bHLH) domain-containing protein [Cynara cardunculus var. scolymus]
MFQGDFMPETEFDNFISTIRTETADPIEKFCFDYECNHFTNCCTDLQLPPTSYGLNQSVIAGAGACTEFGGYDAMDPNVNLIWNQEGDQDLKGSDVYGDDHSSETATTGNPDTPGRSGGGTKTDRSRTLISERKRRSGMKEKLYALRSLVPNITKMDKASIVGDAARYIQELQTQARNLKTDIATIEAAKDQKSSSQNSKKIQKSRSFPLLKKISKMDMFQVEEKGYYVRLVCNTGQGVAVSLHKALESITSFQVQSSNLATVGDSFVLTFTLNVTVCEFDINLPNLKLWLAGAFLNQGFEFTTFPSA